MSDCWHNVVESLQKRYLKVTPEVHNLDKQLIHRIVVDLASNIRAHLVPFDEANYLKTKNGHQKRRLLKAREQIRRCGFNPAKHANISAFVKTERYFEEGKSPRMIMGRDPRFNLFYARVIEPIERAFFSLPQVANACDFVTCGEKFERLVGEWFCENDMSKYEATQRDFHLKLEHEVYCRVMPELRGLIDACFAIKTLKKGHTQSGVGFSFEQCRGSGDLDTSLGNGVLNYIATQYFLVKNFCHECQLANCEVPGCRTYKFVVKGDDSYMTIPRFSTPYNYYDNFGFDAKLVIRKQPEQVEFCSGHFVEYKPSKYIYCQKLTKLIESITTCINRDFVRNGWVAHYYKSLGLMYRKLYSDLPVYRDIADFLCRTHKHGINANLIESWNLRQSFQNCVGTIGSFDESLTTVSIAMTNGLSIPELERLKFWFQHNKLCFPPEYSKRSNLKNKTVEIPPMNWEALENQLLKSEFSKRQTELLRKYKSRAYL